MQPLRTKFDRKKRFFFLDVLEIATTWFCSWPVKDARALFIVMVIIIGTVIATWHVKGFKVMLWNIGTEFARRKIYPRVDQNLPMSRKGIFWHGSCKGPKVLTRFYLSLGATLKGTCYKAVFGSLITLDKIIKNPHPYISAWNGGKAPIGSE